MCAVFAVIPYTTFPTIELGPLNLRTFGLCVALGVLLGAWLAAGYAERYGVERDETYRVATWMVLAGIIGSRLTWAATHTDQIDNPIDVIAIWEGGIQFSGGFIAALIVGQPFFRRWTRLRRWHVLDGYAFGLALGLAFGRIGCYSVGEHFGRTTDFFLATRYDGGDVREPFLDDVPLAIGDTFHNTALYEFLYLMVMFGIMGALVLRARRSGTDLKTGTLVGFFVLVYGICRFLSDSLRVNDERVAGLTGAQWMSLVMIPAGAYILLKVRPKLAALPAMIQTAAEAEAKDAGGAAKGDSAEGEGAEGEGAEGEGAEGEGAEGEGAEGVAESDDAAADEEPDEAAVPSEAEVAADEVAADAGDDGEPSTGADAASEADIPVDDADTAADEAGEAVGEADSAADETDETDDETGDDHVDSAVEESPNPAK